MKRTLGTLFAASVVWGQAQFYQGDLDGRPITYQIHEGQALFEGDIILGPAAKPNGQRNTSFFTGNLWPGGVIPYEIDPTFPPNTLAQLNQAIATWNAYGTPIKLQPRAGEADYSRITRSPLNTGVCSSAVGRRGGVQSLTLEDGCTAPTIIHEIGHTIGMWHEQSRLDRNLHVTVLYENIAKNYAGNYTIGSAGQDLAGYEYGSNMHYRPFSFSVDGRQAIESVPPGIPMGEAPGMNAGDLDAVIRKYGGVPTQTTIATNPLGLLIEVDGETFVAPRTVTWERGSQHVIAVPEVQSSGTLRYTFGKWSNGGRRIHTITATGDETVFTANFVRNVPLVVGEPVNGTVVVDPPSPDGYYPQYTQIKLTATPAPGFRFYRWVSAGGLNCSGNPTSANPLILPQRTIGYGCLAQFTDQPLTQIGSDPPGRLIGVDSLTYTAPANFLFAPDSQHTLNAPTPGAGFASRFRFSEWSDGGEQLHTLTALPEGGTVTAKFTKQFLLSVPSLPAALGGVTVTPASPDGFYDAGTVVSVQTTLVPPLSLLYWTGDLTGRSDPATLTMDDQRFISFSLGTNPTPPPFLAVNALTYQTGPVAPGQLISLFGPDLGPPTPVGPVIDSAGRVATTSGGVRVLFSGVPAPILYASSGQINTVVPYALIPNTLTSVIVEYQGVSKPAVLLAVTAVSPSIVSNGAGLAAVVNQDGTFNGPDHPAPRGSVIVFFGSGEGATSPAGVDGRVGVAPLARPAREVSVRIGGRVADLIYAGNAPNFVAGAMQINARIPADAPTGEVSLYMVVGTTSSPATTKIYVK